MTAKTTRRAARSASEPAVEPVRICEGTIDVLEPIHHGGDEKTGSTPVLRAMTHWDDEAKRFVRLPFISGNAIRGQLRRLIFRDLLARVGFANPSKKLHHALFSGGALEKGSAEGDDDIRFRRWARDTFPPIALFGLSAGNQILTSCLKVGHARLVCRDYRACLPEPHRSDPRAEHPCREWTDISFATRRDDLRERREEGEQATQMKIEFECLVTGARLVHRFVLEHASALEASCFGHTVALWQREPHLGAKSASGYGRVRPEYAGLPSSELYLEYVNEHRERLHAELATLGARCDAAAGAAQGRAGAEPE